MGRFFVLLSLCHLLALVWGNTTSFPQTATLTTSISSSKTTVLPTLSVPNNVANVSVINRTETTLTLQWDKVGGKNYSYILYYNGSQSNISGLEAGSVVTYRVKNLLAGTEYHFILYTVFGGAQSTGYNFTTVTTPSRVNNISVKSRTETTLTLTWDKVNNNYNYILIYNNQTTNISGTGEGSSVSYTVTDLSAGTEYILILHTVFKGVRSAGYSFTTVTTPLSVSNISVKNRTETALTLEWNKVENKSIYSYTLSYNNQNVSISGSGDVATVTYTVTDLTAGTEYIFLLYTVFKEAQSAASTFITVTTPLSVSNISVKNRTETALTLEWNKVENKSIYSYTLSYNNQNVSISGSGDVATVTYTVTDLTAGTEYIFLLYTVFKEAQSAASTFITVTSPLSVSNISVKNRTETALTLEWNKVENKSIYSYTLSYNNQNVSISGSGDVATVTYTVTDLTAGTEYIFLLYTVFKEAQSAASTFITVTSPLSVSNISVKNRTETALTLEWNKVENKSIYSYTLSYNNQNVSISGSGDVATVTYTVTDLTAGTEYIFLLYTVFKEAQSAASTFITVTTPSRVNNISVKSRTETTLTLTWDKVNNNYNYILIYNNQTTNISGTGEGSSVSYTVTDLSAGTEYILILHTVFKGVRSAEYSFTTVTTPLSVTNVYVKSLTETTLTLQWNKVSNNNNYNYRISYDNKNSILNGSGEGSSLMYTVSNLTAGMEYTFTMYTVFKEVESRGHLLTSVTIPNSVTGLRCQHASGGYGLTLLWDPPNGRRTAVQVNISSKSFSDTGEYTYIDGLMPAQWYTLTVSAISGPMQSVPASISCQTDPRGIIGGVLTFLLLAILIISIGIFIWYQKPDLFSKTKKPSDKYKPITLNTFPMHFNTMHCDQSRGFIEEYQDLSTVGTDQSCSVSTLPENKSKNRFSNVLAYDSTRVKLTAQNGSDSDYINANYIHGYGKKNKKYIAAQGPLPTTVNDFWGMVWEQKSSAIVMLTNCTEGGKIKCEKYWPEDNMPCVYGNLQVSTQSEQKESCWIRREFIVRNESTSKEQAVTHFHFTAWPDHGVPIGTADLIQFRWLVRQHIETFPFSGPPVVHCSAGVGRTGTLIALDILLQQMDKEEKVNVADCVHHMRLSRPLMVQTESQYVFLHQCIMDSLTSKEDSVAEPLYENSEIIFANALALKEYKAESSGV